MTLLISHQLGDVYPDAINYRTNSLSKYCGSKQSVNNSRSSTSGLTLW
jgi:hypothetical protein